MSNENELQIKSIVEAIRKFYKALYLDSARTSSQYGLTTSQSDVLRTLLVYGALSSANLSRKLYVTPSNLTGVIDRLEKKGLVERVRQQADRRIALITLTETGKSLSKELLDPIEKRLLSGLAFLGPDEVQGLGNAINIIIKLLDARGIEGVPLGSQHDIRSGIHNKGDETPQNL